MLRILPLRKEKLNAIGIFCLFVLPAFGAVLLSAGIPFLMSFGYSFTKWNGLDRAPEFIGLENYKELLFDDPAMRNALSFTVKQSFLIVIFSNIFALFLAALLDIEIRGRNALRTAFFIPYVISLVVIGYVWRFFVSQGFNSLYDAVGLPILMLSWLGDPNLAFISILTASVWQSVGLYMIIYLAGLQLIPKELTESAMIDGAGGVVRFFRVSLPMLMPSVTVAVFHSIAVSMKSFDLIFSMTGGGPGASTTPIALDIYRTAFVYSRFGYGTAKSVILFLLILLITALQITFFKQREVEVI